MWLKVSASTIFETNDISPFILSSEVEATTMYGRAFLFYKGTMGTKLCGSCNTEKDSCNFSKCEKCKDGLQYRCKECDSLKRKERWAKNKEIESEKNKKWYLNNKEKALEYSSNYFQNNKDKLVHQRKNKRHSNIKTKMIHNFRGIISSSFKRALNGSKVKSCKSLDILGCSMEFFMEYIEGLFTEGMSWDNYGACMESNCKVWNLDHQYPISLANSEEEILKLNHYSNFKPMWAIENIQKSNKI